MKKKKMSVFIDESGDLGNYDAVTEFYILCFVFHDQKDDIAGQVLKLNQSLKQCSETIFAIHTEPLIRKEEIYENMSPQDRRNILTKLFFFSKSCPIKFKTFVFSKKHFHKSSILLDHIKKDVFDFFEANRKLFSRYGEIVIYYDNGQLPIKDMVQGIFSALFESVEMRKVTPADYRLFQTADMLCTFALIDSKLRNRPMSHSEKCIFYSKYDFYHDFYNPIRDKNL